MFPYRNILILSPHIDDSELCAGGFIIRAIEAGARVDTVAFSACDNFELEEEHRQIIVELGIDSTLLDLPVRQFQTNRQTILDFLIQRRNSLKYDLILCPNTFDIHQDHCVIVTEAKRAFKHTTIWGYEMPWNHIDFAAPLFVSLTEKQLAKKWDLLYNYKTQLALKRPYFDKEFIYGLAKVRGVQAGCQYAEMFQFIRGKL